MSRISEVLLGSVSPMQLMLGKLIGCLWIAAILALLAALLPVIPGSGLALPGGGGPRTAQTALTGALNNSKLLPMSKIQSATKKVIINLIETGQAITATPSAPWTEQAALRGFSS